MPPSAAISPSAISHRAHPLRRRLAAGGLRRLQRLDMGFDLDVGPELFAQRRLQPVGDVVGRAERKLAVDLEIERDRTAGPRMSCTVTWCTASARLRAITMTRSSTVSSSSARGAASTPTSARGISARIASATRSLIASTRSSGSVRLTATTTSTNSLSPTGRTRTRSTATTPRDAPATRRTRFGGARRRGIGQRVDGAAAEPPAGDADEHRDDERGGRVRPRVAERDAAEPDQHRDRRPHVGAEMQRVGFQRLARGFAGDAIEQAGAEEIDHDRDDDHREGRRASPRPRGLGRRAAASPPPRSPRRTARTAAPVSASAETLSTLPWP